MPEGFNFRVRRARGAMPALGKKPSAIRDDDGADRWIGAGAAHAPPGFPQGEAHPGFVGSHGSRRLNPKSEI